MNGWVLLSATAIGVLFWILLIVAAMALWVGVA